MTKYKVDYWGRLRTEKYNNTDEYSIFDPFKKGLKYPHKTFNSFEEAKQEAIRKQREYLEIIHQQYLKQKKEVEFVESLKEENITWI